MYHQSSWIGISLGMHSLITNSVPIGLVIWRASASLSPFTDRTPATIHIWPHWISINVSQNFLTKAIDEFPFLVCLMFCYSSVKASHSTTDIYFFSIKFIICQDEIYSLSLLFRFTENQSSSSVLIPAWSYDYQLIKRQQLELYWKNFLPLHYYTYKCQKYNTILSHAQIHDYAMQFIEKIYNELREVVHVSWCPEQILVTVKPVAYDPSLNFIKRNLERETRVNLFQKQRMMYGIFKNDKNKLPPHANQLYILSWHITSNLIGLQEASTDE